jgi:hypothetical protein
MASCRFTPETIINAIAVLIKALGLIGASREHRIRHFLYSW